LINATIMTMRKLLISITLIASHVLLAACSSATDSLSQGMIRAADKIKGIYKIDIAQGNVVDQSMVDQLKPGMDKRQVRFIMGSPMLVDVFHKERWDYYYSLEPASEPKTEQIVSLLFENEKLAQLQGDFRPSNEAKPASPNTKVIDVPRRETSTPNLFERALIFLGMEYEEL
jgi:outer membrane protein assembly factor BamE